MAAMPQGRRGGGLAKSSLRCTDRVARAVTSTARVLCARASLTAGSTVQHLPRPDAIRADACAVSSSICPARGSTTTPPERAAPAIPVVFIHGFPTSSHLWSDVVPLMPPGHRLVVARPARLRPQRPSDRRAPSTSRAHAERVVELLDELRIERACIVGHGIGGGIAQSIAVRHAAARVASLSRSTASRSTAGRSLALRIARASLPFTRFLPAALLLARLRRELERGYADPHPRGALDRSSICGRSDGPEGRDALVAHIRALDEPTRRARSASSAADDHRADGDRLGTSTTACCRSSIGDALAGAIPGATLDVIARRRHFTPEEAPRQVADAIAELLCALTAAQSFAQLVGRLDDVADVARQRARFLRRARVVLDLPSRAPTTEA